ncbi:MAG: tetratricopeptide repeat protein [Nitrososphaeraceae archaeon]
MPADNNNRFDIDGLSILCILLFLTSCVLVTINLLPSATALVKNVSPEVNALVDKGLALDDLGNYTGAIAYYDKALAIDPKNVFALTFKGLALSILGNYTSNTTLR